MKRPEHATAGHPILDIIGVLTHYALYLFTFGMALSGLVMSLQRGYFAQLWGIGSVPQTFNRASYTWEMIHGMSWSFLAGFAALHIGVALYHQFIRRDRLLGRMWVGEPVSAPCASSSPHDTSSVPEEVLINGVYSRG